MAILKGIVSRLTGSAGNLTFRRQGGATILSEKNTNVTNTRTAAQQKHRMKWANVIQMYKGISPLLNQAFENKPARVSDYNMFTKLNLQREPVYLTKAEVTAGACVVAPYQISLGSLPSIEVEGTGADGVTDISLGDLTISGTTTVAEFSNAVVTNNLGWNYGDQLSFFSILQRINSATMMPYGVFTATEVVLSRSNNALLWDCVNAAGFASKGGFLAHGTDEGDGAYCWVHSRKNKSKTLTSTQVLVCSNAIFEDYTSPDAYDRAVNTYGGESDVFLAPKSVDTLSADSGSEGTVTPPDQGDDGADEEPTV